MSNYRRNATTAERIREAMTERDKKQADLVRETGLDRGAISSYLSGKYEPKQDAIYKLALALNVSEMWLWGYDVPKARTVEQKKNDDLAEIVIKLRRDSDFFDAVKDLSALNPDQLASIKQLLKTFLT